MKNAYKDAAMNMGRMVGDHGIHGEVRGRRDAKKEPPEPKVEPDEEKAGPVSASAPDKGDKADNDKNDNDEPTRGMSPVERLEHSFKPKPKRSVHLGGPASYGNKRR